MENVIVALKPEMSDNEYSLLQKVFTYVSRQCDVQMGLWIVVPVRGAEESLQHTNYCSLCVILVIVTGPRGSVKQHSMGITLISNIQVLAKAL